MSSLAEKYRPKKYAEMLGQEKAVIELKIFLKEFPKKKALLLYGPPGTGKTTLALVAALENEAEIFELNSSDLRNRAKLEEILKPASLQTSLFKKNKILLVDEVDGVTGTDIGGIPELIRIIEKSSHPVIITGNDVWQTKLAPLRPLCKMVEMKSLTTDAVAYHLKKIADKENIAENPHFLRQVALKSQGDLRAALNDFQAYSIDKDSLIINQDKRHREDSIFNILKLLFQERQDFLELFDTTDMSLDEILLWIEENIPREYQNEALHKAYGALSNADVHRGRIYRQQHWRFLIYQNIFQSAGIAYAKDRPKQGFTKYERPKRILKIWLNNQKSAKKKTIAQKYARLVHCSIKRVMRDFELLKPIMQKPEVQSQLRLEQDEVEFLKR
ncbi:MAG: replication factor C large subunit [Nanoarchaeota archaeon]